MIAGCELFADQGGFTGQAYLQVSYLQLGLFCKWG
jgi:hypothetical protein